MNYVNRKIIDSIISKAETICPNSLALIGIYGSVATGDEYEKSDLDLLILINDEKGYKLATGFILDDSKIGYDLYCTTINGLRFDSECYSAHLSKLMDSKIIYIKNYETYEELCSLREKTKLFLYSDERYKRVDELIEKAKISYADVCLYDDIGHIRACVCDVMLSLADAIMIYHGTYFKRGVKRIFDELSQFSLDNVFTDNMKKISESKDIYEIRSLAKDIILYVEKYVSREVEKINPTKENIAGTYEEMYSNWRNKVEEASKSNDCFSSFVNMCSLQHMISDISSVFKIDYFDLMGNFQPDCIKENEKIVDSFLNEYKKIYNGCDLYVKSYPDVDVFVEDYINGLV